MTGSRLALALLAAALAGGGAGAWLADDAGAHASTTTRVAAASASHAATARPRTAMPPASRDISALPEDDLGSASARAARDPEYLRGLLQELSAEPHADRRGALIAILGSVANDEVLRYARQRLDSPDPAIRQEALALLSAYPLDRDDVRGVLVAQLGRAREPAAQKQLIEMLTPTVLPTEDAAPVLERLAALRASPDPEVRAASLLQTVQWDRTTPAEPLLAAAILDNAAPVRRAAIAGITVSHQRSDRLKDALLGIASDRGGDGEERQAALFALQDFALDRGEYAVYREAAADTAPAHE